MMMKTKKRRALVKTFGILGLIVLFVSLLAPNRLSYTYYVLKNGSHFVLGESNKEISIKDGYAIVKRFEDKKGLVLLRANGIEDERIAISWDSIADITKGIDYGIENKLLFKEQGSEVCEVFVVEENVYPTKPNYYFLYRSLGIVIYVFTSQQLGSTDTSSFCEVLKLERPL